MDADIIRMAREAGFAGGGCEALFRFAALVRADEREACAKVCEDTDIVEFEHCMVLHQDAAKTLRNAAAAIRARGQPTPCPDCHGIGYDASGQLCACQENPSFG